MAEEGCHEELLAARGAYWALVRQQMGGVQVLPSAEEEPRGHAAHQMGVEAAEIDAASVLHAGEDLEPRESPGGPVAVSEGETLRPPPRSTRFGV